MTDTRWQLKDNLVDEETTSPMGPMEFQMHPEHEEIINRIKTRLRQLRPHKVILFGSHAWGTPDADSDIDLVIVLDDESLPSTFAERMQNVLKVRKCVADINREVSLDLLVYSRKEWQKFLEMDSSFSRELREEGQELL